MKLCGFDIGLDQPFFLIAGPCVVESEQLQLDVAGQLKDITASLGINFIFKSSFDKANRTSGTSFRGPGMEEGLRVLSEVKRQLNVPLLTDVHEYTPMDEVASVVDVLQTPAFLCRQTDFIRACAVSGQLRRWRDGAGRVRRRSLLGRTDERIAGGRRAMARHRSFVEPRSRGAPRRSRRRSAQVSD